MNSYPSSYGQPAYEPTILKPTPGGRRPAVTAPVMPPPSDYRAEDGLDMTLGGLNPLVAAAGPILGLVRRLRMSAGQSNVEGLRERVISEIKTFEKRAHGTEVPSESARAAHYALCAMVDDIVLNTPWGGNSGWARNSMVSTFHMDVSGGERFFDLLNHLLQDPAANGQVLELMYLCLSLGFEGRLRVLPQGALEHARIRDSLYRVLAQRRGDVERDLSLHWQGVAAPYRPLRPGIEFWTVMAATLIVVTLMATGFSFALNAGSDTILSKLAHLPPAGEPGIRNAAPTQPTATVANGLNQLRAFLAPEIAQGLVSVLAEGSDTVVRIRNAGMFDSGSASVDTPYVALLRRIGDGLSTLPGTVLITGHTDNIPIRTIRFPSNWHLSQARADAVGAIIAGRLANNAGANDAGANNAGTNKPGADISRITTEGMADTRPIASNDTLEGREANRRIDVVLTNRTKAPTP
ncbi:type IVB secretion system protein IcmH/DotU [Telmatospirillum sp.]|uniref:type IVB secretion system protein IcmH/DotU n=1 Tax=Telmatospirillum sp. TaxID=2079197 RepID=UPI002842604E|nr:type IVB secretion system protein IcmH/DotU [Telmatospirillum sp.]MDR3435263.1 type IVB secretion system protein IcmH/DotU [Telmatospirillum sp.]